MRKSAQVSNNYNHTPLNNPLRERVIGRKLRALMTYFNWKPFDYNDLST